MKTRFDVSPRMHVFLGSGAVPACIIPRGVEMAFNLRRRTRPTLTVAGDAQAAANAGLVFHVDPDRCRELVGTVPSSAGEWHLGSHQRNVATEILECGLPEPARTTFRIIKSVELLCSAALDLSQERLVRSDAAGALSEPEVRRILKAREMVDERWNERLTVGMIARACGINRSKLAQDFRRVFDCTVGDAIAETRLNGARRMLLATNLSVAAVGFRCGYANSASFARAFARRFGVPPTRVRAEAAA